MAPGIFSRLSRLGSRSIINNKHQDFKLPPILRVFDKNEMRKKSPCKNFLRRGLSQPQARPCSQLIAERVRDCVSKSVSKSVSKFVQQVKFKEPQSKKGESKKPLEPIHRRFTFQATAEQREFDYQLIQSVKVIDSLHKLYLVLKKNSQSTDLLRDALGDIRHLDGLMPRVQRLLPFYQQIEVKSVKISSLTLADLSNLKHRLQIVIDRLSRLKRGDEGKFPNFRWAGAFDPMRGSKSMQKRLFSILGI